MSAKSNSQLLDLPPAWLALLFQHVACGPGGLSNAAALSQTCKFLHTLSEGAAITYRKLILAAVVSSPHHPVWQWLATRSGRIVGLSLDLLLEDADAIRVAGQISDWVHPLQTLSGIPGVELRVELVGIIADVDHPFIRQWLKQHGQLISHLTVEVDISQGRLLLRKFAQAAAVCRSIDIAVQHFSDEAVDLSDLDFVAGSLHRLTCEPIHDLAHHSLRGTSALTSMSQLTTLHLDRQSYGSDEPWVLLGKVTSLRELRLDVSATGDPSPLSSLTRLSSLSLGSQRSGEMNNQVPFTFSSLQPLSTLQQLEELHLWTYACAVTSLQGLAGLSNLKVLGLENAPYNRRVSLDGISPGVVDLTIAEARDLVSLAGIEVCTRLEKLSLYDCGVSSLHCLVGLSSLKELLILGCYLNSLESLKGMSIQTLSLEFCSSLTELSGVEYLTALKSLHLNECGMTSLQALSQLGEGLQKLDVYYCSDVQEEVLELPHVQPTADVEVMYSNVKEVVLAGSVRKVVASGD
jgi:hypothetical protein